MSDIDGLTSEARDAVSLTQEAARQLGSPYTGAEHLILGLINLDSGAALPALAALGLSHDRARDAVASFSGIEQDLFQTETFGVASHRFWSELGIDAESVEAFQRRELPQ